MPAHTLPGYLKSVTALVYESEQPKPQPRSLRPTMTKVFGFSPGMCILRNRPRGSALTTWGINASTASKRAWRG